MGILFSNMFVSYFQSLLQEIIFLELQGNHLLKLVGQGLDVIQYFISILTYAVTI